MRGPLAPFLLPGLALCSLWLVRDAAPVFAVPRLRPDGLEAWKEVERRGLKGYVSA